MTRRPYLLFLTLCVLIAVVAVCLRQSVSPPAPMPGLAITVVVATMIPAPTLAPLIAGSPTTRTPRPVPEPILTPRATSTPEPTDTPTPEPTVTETPRPTPTAMQQKG